MEMKDMIRVRSFDLESEYEDLTGSVRLDLDLSAEDGMFEVNEIAIYETDVDPDTNPPPEEGATECNGPLHLCLETDQILYVNGAMMRWTGKELVATSGMAEMLREVVKTNQAAVAAPNPIRDLGRDYTYEIKVVEVAKETTPVQWIPVPDTWTPKITAEPPKPVTVREMDNSSAADLVHLWFPAAGLTRTTTDNAFGNLTALPNGTALKDVPTGVYTCSNTGSAPMYLHSHNGPSTTGTVTTDDLVATLAGAFR